MKKNFLIGVACLVGGSITIMANNDTGEKNKKEEPDINGVVIKSENGKPLKNVLVVVYQLPINKKEKMATTDSSGSYSLIDLRPGVMYRLVFEKEGYKKVVKEKIFLKVNEIFSLNIEMLEEEVFDLMPSPNHFFGERK